MQKTLPQIHWFEAKTLWRCHTTSPQKHRSFLMKSESPPEFKQNRLVGGNIGGIHPQKIHASCEGIYVNKKQGHWLAHLGVDPKIWENHQIIHFNRVFHYKPSILGYPYFWKSICTMFSKQLQPLNIVLGKKSLWRRRQRLGPRCRSVVVVVVVVVVVWEQM